MGVRRRSVGNPSVIHLVAGPSRRRSAEHVTWGISRLRMSRASKAILVDALLEAPRWGRHRGRRRAHITGLNSRCPCSLHRPWMTRLAGVALYAVTPFYGTLAFG